MFLASISESVGRSLDAILLWLPEFAALLAILLIGYIVVSSRR